MKKNLVYVSLAVCFALLLGTSAFCETSYSQQQLFQQVSQKATQADPQRQVVKFFKKIAQKNPAQLATLVLGYKDTYVHDSNVVYIGIKGEDEALVICEIEDFEVGTFYYAVTRKGDKTSSQEHAAAPAPQGFVTLFQRAAQN